MDRNAAARDLIDVIARNGCRKISKLFDDGFKGMFVILRILRYSDDDIMPSDIAKLMGVSTARVAVALKSLSEKGYIERIPASTDGRRVVLRITQAGSAALSAREETIKDLIAAFLQKLTDDEVVAFSAIMKKLFS
ncbi:MAG: MarR family transcriptional regulator [Roseburia sp.]|nr:MarR family transcriptional regulator [Roseburia sp.]